MIGYVPQQLSADAALTGRENVRCSPGCSTSPRASARARGDELLEAMGLTDAADRLVSTYSGGMIRRLELAQALVNRPAAAGARRADDRPRPDRPGRACGSGSTSCASETGMTVLMTTHYMEEADALCDRIALMHRARLRAIGTPDELKAAARPGRDARRRVPPPRRRDTLDSEGGDMRHVRPDPAHRNPAWLASAPTSSGGRRPAPGGGRGSRVAAHSAWSSCRSSATTADLRPDVPLRRSPAPPAHGSPTLTGLQGRREGSTAGDRGPPRPTW